MENPDEDVLRSMVNLEGNPNWERIFAWIHRSRKSATLSLRAEAAAELEDLIDKVEGAKAKFEDIKRTRDLQAKNQNIGNLY